MYNYKYIQIADFGKYVHPNIYSHSRKIRNI